MKKYPVNEVFYSLQGEGRRAGRPSVFVRFSGCNLMCMKETHGFDCDTEFRSTVLCTAESVVERIASLWPSAHNKPEVVFTGGEPLLHLDADFMQAVPKEWELALETNGSLALDESVRSRLGHVACSPKVAEHAIRLEPGQVEEWRYVRSAEQGIPKPPFCARWQYLSPAWTTDGVDGEALQRCIDLCLQHPAWSLSLQQHKVWRIR